MGKKLLICEKPSMAKSVANALNVPKKGTNYENSEFVIILGEDEQKENVVTMKKFSTGEQEKYKLEEIIKLLK